MSAASPDRHRRIFRSLLRLYPEVVPRRARGGDDAPLRRPPGAGGGAPGHGCVSGGGRRGTRYPRRVALRRGNTEGGGHRMETLLQDLRYAARHLLRSPVFTLGAVALLAIGIGANTTVFTVVDALLFRPPPWSHPERVVHVYQDSDDGEPSSSSYPATRTWRGRTCSRPWRPPRRPRRRGRARTACARLHRVHDVELHEGARARRCSGAVGSGPRATW